MWPNPARTASNNGGNRSQELPRYSNTQHSMTTQSRTEPHGELLPDALGSGRLPGGFIGGTAVLVSRASNPPLAQQGNPAALTQQSLQGTRAPSASVALLVWPTATASGSGGMNPCDHSIHPYAVSHPNNDPFHGQQEIGRLARVCSETEAILESFFQADSTNISRM